MNVTIAGYYLPLKLLGCPNTCLPPGLAVMLQPFEYDPTEKNKHKFMVQTMIAPDGDVNQDTVVRETYFILMCLSF